MGFSGWLELKVGTMRHHVGPSITSLFPVTGNLVCLPGFTVLERRCIHASRRWRSIREGCSKNLSVELQQIPENLLKRVLHYYVMLRQTLDHGSPRVVERDR